jgi:hypothetical protein
MRPSSTSQCDLHQHRNATFINIAMEPSINIATTVDQHRDHLPSTWRCDNSAILAQ